MKLRERATTKRVIIIHGWEGTPNSEWLPWVGNMLQQKGFRVEIPEMPNTGRPKLNQWLEKLESLSPDDDTILIGHSLANALIFKYLEKPNTNIKAAVMVAAWDWLIEDVREFHETFFETGFNYESIKSKQATLIIINSTNDRWIDFDRSKQMADKLNAKFIAVKNAGHFMEKDGYKEFPQLVKIVDHICMNKVRILIEGYAHPGGDNTFIASPTTILIEAKDKKILVDPGTNKDKLLNALQELEVKHEDISFIYLSHYHPDHFLNLKLFPNLDVYDGEMVWSNDTENLHEGDLKIDGIKILKTPGHSPEHTSLLIDTNDGKVCIAQDVFWWEDGKQNSATEEALLSLEDPFATDKHALLVSRKLVLDNADWIIPGHGKKFKNPRKNKY